MLAVVLVYLSCGLLAGLAAACASRAAGASLLVTLSIAVQASTWGVIAGSLIQPH